MPAHPQGQPTSKKRRKIGITYAWFTLTNSALKTSQEEASEEVGRGQERALRQSLHVD